MASHSVLVDSLEEVASTAAIRHDVPTATANQVKKNMKQLVLRAIKIKILMCLVQNDLVK